MSRRLLHPTGRRLSPVAVAFTVTVSLFLALCFGAARPAAAETDFFRRDNDDVSVYRIWPWIDGAVILGSNAVTVGFYGFGGGLIHPSCPCDPGSVNAFDRLAIGNHSDALYDLGTATVVATILAPVALDLWDLRRFWPVLEDTTVLAEALSLSGAFNTVAKFTVRRPFPRTYAGDPGLVNGSGGYHSFYSGHTALAFTALSVTSMTIGRRYGVHAIPWIATVLIGSTVAAEMVLAGWHFPTDTIAGALAGTAVGVVVPLAHFSRWRLVPAVGVAPGGGGPLLSLSGPWF